MRDNGEPTPGPKARSKPNDFSGSDFSYPLVGPRVLRVVDNKFVTCKQSPHANGATIARVAPKPRNAVRQQCFGIMLTPLGAALVSLLVFELSHQ